LPAEQQEYLQLMDDAAGLLHRINRYDTSLQEHDAQLGDLQGRVAALEARLQGTDFLNPAQMKQYTDMVGLVAFQLKQKRKGTEATVHAEVKGQFKVPSYQLIPEAEFDQVKQFLGSWYRRLAGPGVPLPSIFESPSQKRLL
jgi:hypothetical protein